MSMNVGASSNALAYLQQLLQQGTAGASSAGAADPLSELMQTLSGSGSDTDPLTSPTSTAATGSGASSVPPFGSGTMAQLLTLQHQSGKGPEQAFFSKLDSDGDGKITKSEFESAASKAGVDSSVADAVFDKIDGNSDGSVSLGELAKADHGGHHHVHGGGGGGRGMDALMSGSDVAGATTTTTSNADGSTTTTIKYADGSSIDMNTPAATSASASTSGDSSSSNTLDSGSGSSSGSRAASNLLEQLIKMQSQMLSAMQASASTMSIAA